MPVRSESEIFSDLERLCGEPGYIHVFSSLVVKNTFVFYGDAITGKNFENTFGDDRLIRTELCTLLGLMLKGDLDFSRPSDDHLGEMEHRTLFLLEEMHHAMASGVRLRLEQVLEKPRPQIDFGHGETLREPVFYTGESAFSTQYVSGTPTASCLPRAEGGSFRYENRRSGSEVVWIKQRARGERAERSQLLPRARCASIAALCLEEAHS
jgi:hypothetical protein